MRRQRGDRIRASLRPRRGLILIASVLVVATLLSILFVGRQMEIASRRATLEELEQERILALEAQVALRDRLAQRDDLEAIEAVAREKLGLVLPGEEKVVFVEEATR